MQRLSDSVIGGLRDALTGVEFTVDRVTELLGERAFGALTRNETTPAVRRTSGGSPLESMVRLWSLQQPVSRAAADAALPDLVEPLRDAGLLDGSAEEVRALVDLRPYASDGDDWWVVSDLTPGLDGAARRIQTDHVLGVSGASTNLAQLTVRAPVGRALDLGTGSGVQALHLSQHAATVVATDVNPRCLLLADLTARLNDVTVDLRAGSLWEPVRDEQFDLIVTNPPFVVSPATGERLIYRDSGLPGDEVVRQVVVGAAERLTDGGRCHVLANWVHREEQPWSERLADWVATTGCDAWAVQRELTDVSRYVELWLDDAGLRGALDYTQRYDAWLSWFEQQGIAAIGFGWLVLRKAGRETPYVQIESWPYEVEQPLGPHVARWSQVVDLVQASDDDALLARRLVAAPDVREERVGPPGGAAPELIVMRSQRGMRRAHRASTAVAAMIGACDGELTLGQIADALADLLDRPVTEVRVELLAATRTLLVNGILEPCR